jgi:hypothetical protein
LSLKQRIGLRHIWQYFIEEREVWYEFEIVRYIMKKLQEKMIKSSNTNKGEGNEKDTF